MALIILSILKYAFDTAYRDGTMHVVFDRDNLPPYDFMADLELWVRTNLTRFD